MSDLTPGDQPAETTSLQTCSVPCLVCGKSLQAVHGPGQPYDALAFTSYGHYGTTFFDPMDGSTLNVMVCDECLCTAQAWGRTYELPPTEQHSPSAAEKWAALKDRSEEVQVLSTLPTRLAYTVTCDACFYAFHCTEETSRLDQFRPHIRKTVCPSCTAIIPFAASSNDLAPSRTFITHLSDGRAEELFEMAAEIGATPEQLIASAVNAWIDKAGEVL